MIKRMDHAIMVVKNLEESTKIFKNLLHLTPNEGGFVADLPKFRVAMFPFIGGARVELIEPKQNVESRFKKFLNERGEGVMAISFFTDDLEAQIKDLKDNGFAAEEEVQADLFPDHAFRIVWVPPQKGYGIWLEFVDTHDLPAFEQ
jgi:4-hydroxyphenylpyruvate dioxygenase-like putative hemolysin